MRHASLDFDVPSEYDLHQVIEPLASFICAAERPRAALLSALTVLFSEVEETNRIAAAHCGHFPESF